MVRLFRARRSAFSLALMIGAPAAVAAPGNDIKDNIYPPWQGGANNDAVDRGLEFTVPEVGRPRRFSRRSDGCQARALCRRQLFLRNGPAGRRIRARAPRLQGTHLLGDDPARLVGQADRRRGHHYGRQHDLDCKGRCLSCRTAQSEGDDRRRADWSGRPYLMSRTRSPSWCQRAIRRISPALAISARPASGS